MLKVVLAEDEANVLAELELAVPWEDWGCLVAGKARDGLEALELIAAARPDLVVTDVRMPGLDGIALVERAQEALGDDAPEFVIVSGYDEFEYARRAMKLGVRSYLLKPFDDAELEAAVDLVRRDLARRREAARRPAAAVEAGASLFAEYAPASRDDPQLRHVEKAVERIRDSYQRDLSVEEAAEGLGISAGYLSRIFKRETGYTFVDYLVHYRVKRAAELLRTTDLKIHEVADLVGYADQRYFSQVFRRGVGLTPSQFKDSTR